MTVDRAPVVAAPRPAQPPTGPAGTRVRRLPGATAAKVARPFPLLLIVLLTVVELGLCLFAQRTVRAVTSDGVRIAQEIQSRLGR